MTALHPASLSEEEKARLFRDGFVVLKNAVSGEMIAAAKAAVHDNPRKIVNNDARLVGLYNDTILADVLNEAMGPHTRPTISFAAITQPRLSDAVGAREIDVDNVPPPRAHVDGGWAGLCPMSRSEILASGQTLHTWGSEDDPRWMGPAGGAPLWQDPDKRLAIGSFTAFVGICLNDQTVPGRGQLAVRRGAHEAVEKFFRMQRDAGGPIGGGGPAWPRLVPGEGDDALAGVMPKALVDSYPETRFEADGWPWPELTPVLMDEGDAVVTLHALPHTATPNLADEPRMNIYFRIRRHRPENPYEGDRRVGWGLSDHPDRALNGDFLDYPGTYDPYQTSIDKLCDHWSEWQGMQHIVADGSTH